MGDYDPSEYLVTPRRTTAEFFASFPAQGSPAGDLVTSSAAAAAAASTASPTSEASSSPPIHISPRTHSRGNSSHVVVPLLSAPPRRKMPAPSSPLHSLPSPPSQPVTTVSTSSTSPPASNIPSKEATRESPLPPMCGTATLRLELLLNPETTDRKAHILRRTGSETAPKKHDMTRGRAPERKGPPERRSASAEAARKRAAASGAKKERVTLGRRTGRDVASALNRGDMEALLQRPLPSGPASSALKRPMSAPRVSRPSTASRERVLPVASKPPPRRTSSSSPLSARVTSASKKESANRVPASARERRPSSLRGSPRGRVPPSSARGSPSASRVSSGRGKKDEKKMKGEKDREEEKKRKEEEEEEKEKKRKEEEEEKEKKRKEEKEEEEKKREEEEEEKEKKRKEEKEEEEDTEGASEVMPRHRRSSAFVEIPPDLAAKDCRARKRERDRKLLHQRSKPVDTSERKEHPGGRVSRRKPPNVVAFRTPIAVDEPMTAEARIQTLWKHVSALRRSVMGLSRNFEHDISRSSAHNVFHASRRCLSSLNRDVGFVESAISKLPSKLRLVSSASMEGLLSPRPHATT